MKRGILGLGHHSTQYYVGEIQRRFKIDGEEFSTYPYLLYQIDFQEINPFLPDQFDKLIPQINFYFNDLANFGISKLLIPNVTLHETLDQIKFDVEICHPIDLTIAHLQENKIAKVYLFGTAYTMNSPYLKDKFSANKIEIIGVEENDQQAIDTFRKAVYGKEETSTQIKEFQNLIRKYSVKYPVLIACTELSIYALKNDVNCIDMADLQITEFLK